MSSALQNLDPAQRQVVREKVRSLLRETSAFEALPADQRKKMARSLVDVVAFLADPSAGQKEGAVGDQPTLSEVQAKRDEGDKGGLVQNDFKAAAGQEGAEIFERLTAAVDFPEFVSQLIDGVFNSIVTASIRQMDAYSRLLESVVKSVDEFAKDNFTPNQGRDWLAGRYPQAVQVQVSGGTPRLGLAAGADEDRLATIQKDLGLDQEIDLDDEESELALAQRGQFEMAKLRQKQLATMVLLGINRIVVTDGLINAKVVIDVRTEDKAQRINTATSYDSAEAHASRSGGGGWFSSGRSQSSASVKTVVTSAMDETSESNTKTKAQLSGHVQVKFKSETFDLNKLASQTQLDSVNRIASSDGAVGG